MGKIEAFKAQIEDKIQNLLHEFSRGEISLAQFNAIYERYNGQLVIANIALASGNANALNEALQGPPTLAVKEKHMGKAVGVLIHHYNTATVLKIIGDFDAPEGRLQAAFDEFSRQLENEQQTDGHLVEQLGDGRWLLFTTVYWTCVITLFQNEPSGTPIHEIQRLHQDFEIANEAYLVADEIDADELAYPFLVVTQQKF